MNTLDEVMMGSTIKIKKIHGEGALRRRLFDMGLTPNVSVFVRKVAPLGDPIEINVRSYELTLRKAEASVIEIE